MECRAELIYYCLLSTDYCLLLLLVRNAEGARGARGADEAGEDDDGQHVGDDLDELGRYLLAAEGEARERDGDRRGESGEQAGEPRLGGATLADEEAEHGEE